jgi:hypothetical protein
VVKIEKKNVAIFLAAFLKMYGVYYGYALKAAKEIQEKKMILSINKKNTPTKIVTASS